MKGFTVVEVLLSIAIFGLLTGIATVALANVQHKSQIDTVAAALVTDLKDQQVRAMVGDGAGTGSAANYGVRFGSTQYTLYRTSYGTSNYIVKLSTTLRVTFASASSDLVFLKGSGEIPGYASSSAIITLRDTVDNSQKVISLNRYGVITSIQ